MVKLRFVFILCTLKMCWSVRLVMPKTSTSSTTPMRTSALSGPSRCAPAPLNIYQSAVFLCGNVIFGNDLAMVFPPSEATRSRVTNATLAKLEHTTSIGMFCKSLEHYSNCVEQFVRNSNNPIEQYVMKYVDVDNFALALNKYCQNKELVKSQYACTLDVVNGRKHQCRLGGIHGTMRLVAMGVAFNLSKEGYCQLQSEATRCRLQQLQQCGVTYASVMATLYSQLTAKYCTE